MMVIISLEDDRMAFSLSGAGFPSMSPNLSQFGEK
jgi:hypothetical protein